jgi:hypothetical protein
MYDYSCTVLHIVISHYICLFPKQSFLLSPAPAGHMDGGGAKKMKAIKKNKLEKGETSYDYECDDGLGPSTFKKKSRWS